MRDQLLRIIYELGDLDAIGEADADKCRERLSLDKETFDRIVSQLDQRGYLTWECSVGSLKLSRSGIHAAQQLR